MNFSLSTNYGFISEHVAHQHKMEFDYKKRNSCCNSLDIVVHIVIQHMDTTGYNSLFSTLLVVDEFGEGQPGACCLSTHEDVMKILFSKGTRRVKYEKTIVVYE